MRICMDLFKTKICIQEEILVIVVSSIVSVLIAETIAAVLLYWSHNPYSTSRSSQPTNDSNDFNKKYLLRTGIPSEVCPSLSIKVTSEEEVCKQRTKAYIPEEIVSPTRTMAHVPEEEVNLKVTQMPISTQEVSPLRIRKAVSLEGLYTSGTNSVSSVEKKIPPKARTSMSALEIHPSRNKIQNVFPLTTRTTKSALEICPPRIDEATSEQGLCTPATRGAMSAQELFPAKTKRAQLIRPPRTKTSEAIQAVGLHPQNTKQTVGPPRVKAAIPAQAGNLQRIRATSAKTPRPSRQLYQRKEHALQELQQLYQQKQHALQELRQLYQLKESAFQELEQIHLHKQYALQELEQLQSLLNPNDK